MTGNTFGDLIEASYFGNTIEAYLYALLVVLGVALALWIVQRVLITRLHKLAEKTQSKLDDYLIDLIRRLGVPVYLFIGFYIATRSLVLSPSIDRIIGISLVIFLTVKVIQVLQLLILFSVDRSYGRARPCSLTKPRPGKQRIRVFDELDCRAARRDPTCGFCLDGVGSARRGAGCIFPGGFETANARRQAQAGGRGARCLKIQLLT